MSIPPPPLGERGKRPVIFPTPLPESELSSVLDIPGVGYIPGRVLAAWDVAPIVAEQMNYDIPSYPLALDITSLPGYADYLKTGLHEVLRAYQKEGVWFLIHRGGAILSFAMRGGKTLTSLAAARVLGAQHVLVGSPAGLSWVWGEEIAKWFKEGAIILQGRGGRLALRYCVACDAMGVLPDGMQCPDCVQLNGSSYGYNIISVRTVSRRRFKKTKGMRLNLLREPPMGPARKPKGGWYRCSVHEDVVSHDKKRLCMKCREELLEVVRTSRYVLCSYEIMSAQQHRGSWGEDLGMRLDLPGWAPILERISWDVAILDEIHNLRGRPTKERRGKARQDRLRDALRKTKRVWGLSGTIVWGYVRDLYMPLKIVTDDLLGASHYPFDGRYCEGVSTPYGGYEATGRSRLADTELKRRLEMLIMRKDRREIEPELPPKQRQLIRIDPDGEIAEMKLAAPTKAGLGEVFGATLEHKLETVVENVLNEIAEGNFVLVLTFLVASSFRVSAELEKAMALPRYRHLMQRANALPILTHAKLNQKEKHDITKRVRTHAAAGGGGYLCSTIDLIREGYSLRGITSVHHVEVHHSSGALLQAEDRANEGELPHGLGVTHYIVKGSGDERAMSGLIRKLKTADAMIGDSAARGAYEVLDEKKDVEEMVARLTAHL